MIASHLFKHWPATSALTCRTILFVAASVGTIVTWAPAFGQGFGYNSATAFIKSAPAYRAVARQHSSSSAAVSVRSAQTAPLYNYSARRTMQASTFVHHTYEYNPPGLAGHKLSQPFGLQTQSAGSGPTASYVSSYPRVAQPLGGQAATSGSGSSASYVSGAYPGSGSMPSHYGAPPPSYYGATASYYGTTRSGYATAPAPTSGYVGTSVAAADPARSDSSSGSSDGIAAQRTGGPAYGQQSESTVRFTCRTANFACLVPRRGPCGCETQNHDRESGATID
jgi:hypothetical protein